MDHILTISETAEPRPALAPPEFTVQGFGKVSEASVHVAPLTILVGKNNTGKSYIATLLWAMMSAEDALFSVTGEKPLAAPIWFQEYVNDKKNKKREPIEIRGEDVSQHLNEYLRRNKDAIFQNLFSYSGANIDKIEITISGSIWLTPAKAVPKQFAEFKNVKSSAENSWQIGWSRKAAGEASFIFATFLSDENADNARGADELYLAIVQKLLQFYRRGFAHTATYVPAARTGLMLSLPALYTSLIENFGIADMKADRGRFSLPTIRFLQRITRDRQPPDHRPFAHIADFLEENIVKGSVERDSGISTSFSYKPAGSTARLPLHAVSSMVSELSPLLAVLRQGSLGSGLVLEEPEAHLHLAAQRWMARAIAKLVNLNVPVVITTHSDTFLQQINLLVRLNYHPEKKRLMEKYGYADDELLSLEQVEAFEFCAHGSETNVRKAGKSEGGIVVQTLNETLYSLAEEALAVDDD